MEHPTLHGEGRGVSPVIGVILMVAITVVLAAVIGTYVLGIGPGTVDVPQTNWESSQDGTTSGVQSVTFEHSGGDPVQSDALIVVADGERSTISADQMLRTGSTVEVGFGGSNATDAGEEIQLVWDGGSGSEKVVATHRLTDDTVGEDIASVSV